MELNSRKNKYTIKTTFPGLEVSVLSARSAAVHLPHDNESRFDHVSIFLFNKKIISYKKYFL